MRILVVRKEEVHVPLLQYTDDTLLFCKYDEDMLFKLNDTSTLIQWCSGQKINREKPAFSGVNLSDDELNYMDGKLGRPRSFLLHTLVYLWEVIRGKKLCS